MLGSYAPAPTPYTKNFEPEESPSGMLARSGSYNVRSRVVDDDGEIYAGPFIEPIAHPLLTRLFWQTLSGPSS